jgi:RNA polymerase sigma-70 factor, ECF subfamily
MRTDLQYRAEPHRFEAMARDEAHPGERGAPPSGRVTKADPATDRLLPDPRFRAVFDAHYDFVFRSLQGLGVHPGSLDDGTQKVFWLAFQKFDTIIAGNERPYLFRLAKGIASNLRRTVHRNREVTDHAALERHPDGNAGPEEQAVFGEARALLDEALFSMPEDLRVAFVLFELEEMPIPDIAASLEIPIGTVCSRLRRAREKFRIALRRVRIAALQGRVE